jgi:carbonic anhydrase/acetyltransferase-like protein (isoleucine patch superfamily)
MPIYSHRGVRPVLGRDVYVAPNAVVIGDVHLDDESSVWFGTIIRGDVFPIRIGARTNVQDGSVVHVTNGRSATHVGDDVTIGHMALLHGCTVKSGSLIGMGAIVLDDAVIGEECVVAAGALVPPKMVVPPRSMVMGRPAKIVRQLTDQDLAWVVKSGELYVEYARTFRTEVLVLDVDEP